MKKLFLIALLFISFASFGQYTLSEKATLSATLSFQVRIKQALFSKSNVFLNQTPTNLEWQKKVNYAKLYSKTSSSVDIAAACGLFLANYNGVPVVDGNGQPTDSQILNANALDVVFNNLAGINAGDDQLPIN